MRRFINPADRRQRGSLPRGISLSTSTNTAEASLDQTGAFALGRASHTLGRLVMNSIIDRFLIWWLHTGRYRWSWLRRRLCERRYLTTVLPAASSLEEIEACLRQVKWTMDGPLHLFDCISYPQVTWARKKDDCDGFASLAAELLYRWNPNCSPVLVTAMVRPVRASHTVCVFTAPQGSLCFFDNNSLRCDDCQTYDEVVARISQGAQRLVCWDVRDPITLEMLEF